MWLIEALNNCSLPSTTFTSIRLNCFATEGSSARHSHAIFSSPQSVSVYQLITSAGRGGVRVREREILIKPYEGGGVH